MPSETVLSDPNIVAASALVADTSVTTATSDAQLATAMIGAERNDPNGLKEAGATHLGNGVYLTDSRFRVEDDGEGMSKAHTFIHGRGTDNEQASFVVPTSSDGSVAVDLDGAGADEVAVVKTGVDAGTKIGMVIYADPDEVAGDFNIIGYSRSEQGEVMREYEVTISENAYQDITLNNRVEANDVWATDGLPIPADMLGGFQGSGVFQEVDGTQYLAGVLVGPVRGPADQAFVVDPVSDNYQELAEQMLEVGEADDYARNLLVAKSTGGELLGTDLNEDFIGSEADDTLSGDGGDDDLDGGAGDDLLRGGRGNDTISGDAGNDRLVGGKGEDLLNGSDGNDRIFAGADDDTLFGGAGNDVLQGGSGDNVMFGGLGNDRVTGRQDDDYMDGGAGNDFIRGAQGNDTMLGQGGDDRLVGGQGLDVIYGGDGADRIWAGKGNDIALGGDGGDRVNGGDGNDFVYGGEGNDILNGSTGSDTVYGGLGDDRMTGGEGEDYHLFGGSVGGGADTVQDFVIGEDQLVFEGITFGDEPGDLTAAQFLEDNGFFDGRNLVIDLGGGETVTLRNFLENGEAPKPIGEYAEIVNTDQESLLPQGVSMFDLGGGMALPMVAMPAEDAVIEEDEVEIDPLLLG